jgi:hypothetical protein
MTPWLQIVGVCCGLAVAWVVVDRISGNDAKDLPVEIFYTCFVFSAIGCALFALVKAVKWMWGVA